MVLDLGQPESEANHMMTARPNQALHLTAALAIVFTVQRRTVRANKFAGSLDGGKGGNLAEQKTEVEWSRDGAAFTDNRYSRGHR